MSERSEIAELIEDVKEYVLYMKELGVELLDVPPVLAASVVEITAKPDHEALRVSETLRYEAPNAAPAQSSLSRLKHLPSLAKRESLLSDSKGIRRSSSLTTGAAGHPEQQATKAEFARGEVTRSLPQSSETVADIHEDIGNCSRCPLWEGRTQIVHSKGDLAADLMFIGEAPGADEDAQGAPFVGRAGQLLTKIIEGIGLKREEVFIGNINRCRPPGNRAPTLAEADTCKPFLLREIAIVRPRVIVVMGNTATQNLLKTKMGITRLRGEFQDYYGIKVMPTFHPAYLLRDPNKKREVWEDLKKVRDYLNSQPRGSSAVI